MNLIELVATVAGSRGGGGVAVVLFFSTPS